MSLQPITFQQPSSKFSACVKQETDIRCFASPCNTLHSKVGSRIPFWTFSYCLVFQFATISSTKTKSMAMCGNHIQRVNIVVNDNVIEQVTDFNL